MATLAGADGEPECRARRRAPPPPVPVTLATVEKAAFPVYQNGLGTVQAFNTVLVRTRVDGQIERIAFKEGQMVQAGDLLVQIDPRPFRPRSIRPMPRRRRTRPTLANARLDLQRFTSSANSPPASRPIPSDDRRPDDRADRRPGGDRECRRPSSITPPFRAPIYRPDRLRQVDVGNIVNAATQTGIVTIAQIEPISVIFTAPEEQLPDIKAALAAGLPGRSRCPPTASGCFRKAR